MSDAEEAVAGVDLGGTGTRLVIASSGTVLAQVMQPTRELGAGSPDERVSRLAAILTELVPHGRRLVGVGVGASGPVELPLGPIKNLDTLPWFSGFDLVGSLGAKLGVTVLVDNDAVTAALGEHRYGAGRGCSRLLVVTLGTGIGVAFLEDGRPFRDGNGQHPECGHLPVLPSGPRCYCGLAGCWEMSANRASLEARVQSVLGSPDLGELDHLLAHGAEEPVLAAIDDYGRAVGRGLEAIVIAYDPKRVVFCGSASRFLPHFSRGLHAEMERSSEFRRELEIVGSELGDLAGAVGASVMVELLAKKGTPSE